MSDARQAGFTLLELLVGLVILGFIIAGLSQGVRYGFRAADTQARLGSARNELDAIDRTLRTLIEQADPGDGRTPASLSGTAAQLAFTSELPRALARYRPADVAIAVAPDHRLILRWRPHRHVEPLGPAPAPAEAELLRGVDHLELAYWRDTWLPAWDAATLPALIRLRIVFQPGDARHWPDIIVAPKRSSGRS